ncbi:MAG: type II toxin-antitoxin system VapC family toxin [Pirellula sp.]
MSSIDTSPVGIDSQLLMHANREKFNDEHERANHAHAKSLLTQLFRNRVQVCLSIISVSEFLFPYDDTQKIKEIANLEKAFSIVPFNNRAAILASSIARESKELIDGTRPNDRALVLADAKILASLIVHGCKRIESLDKKFIAIATRRGCLVNTIPFQRLLPSMQTDDKAPKRKRK